MSRRNPYTEPRPVDWSSMTKAQRGAWNRSHWVGEDGSRRTFAQRVAARRHSEEQSKRSHDNAIAVELDERPLSYPHVFKKGGWFVAVGPRRSVACSSKAEALGIVSRSNPLVAFRTRRGHKVKFWARHKKRGPTPRHLRPYLFKSKSRSSPKRRGHRGRR